MNRANYAALIEKARGAGDEQYARELEAEWNMLVEQKAAATARKRERTLRKNIEAAWMAGIDACEKDGTMPKDMPKYMQDAWRAGYYGQSMPG